MPSERRLHPISILFLVGANARSLIVPLILVLFAARSASWEIWVLWLLIPYAVFALARYLSFKYEYAEDELIIRTGIIFRNVRHIPYVRIHNVGSMQNPLHRLFGVVDVKVETAGGEKAEAHIQVLSRRALEEMQRRVFEEKRKASTSEGAPGESRQRLRAAAPQEPMRTLLHMPLRELVVYGLIDNRGMLVLGAAMGLAWEFGWWERIPGRELAASLFRAGERLDPVAAVMTGAAVLLAGIVALRVLSIGWAFLKLYDFTLQCSDKDIKLSHGLLTQVSTTIPLQRVQLLSVRERPLHRLFDRAEVRVLTAGGESSAEASFSRQMLAPLIRKTSVFQLVEAVHPEVDFEAILWEKIDPRAAGRIFRKSLLLIGVVTLALAWLAGPAGFLALVLVPLAHLDARRQVRHTEYALLPGMVLFRSGWIWRHLSMARYGKIQAVTILESPFDRRHRMAKVQVDTAGAAHASHLIHIPYLSLDMARRVTAHLELLAAQTTFHW